MEMDKAISDAIGSMRIEGFVYTEKEKTVLAQIAKGELPLNAIDALADQYDKNMRKTFADRYTEEEQFRG